MRILAEGILALHDPALRALYDLKVQGTGVCGWNSADGFIAQIFVQCDSDLMLARRIKRDVTERGRSVDGILEQLVHLPYPLNAHSPLGIGIYDT